MDNKLALDIITSMITAVLLLVITGIDADNYNCKKIQGSDNKINNCGNYVSPTNVTCSKFGLNSEGHESINNISIVNHHLSRSPLKRLGRLHTLIRCWHYVVANGVWIIEVILNISKQNTIAISTNTKRYVSRHDLVAQHYRHLFYREYTEVVPQAEVNEYYLDKS